MSLLPPNASPLERALESATARLGAVSVEGAVTLWNPATCPAMLLPWLAWSLSVDSWEPTWSDDFKRSVVADAIAAHRRKGTRATVEAVLHRLDGLATLVEWWQATPAADPHTAEIQLPIAGAGIAPGGARASAAFADKVLAEISKVKPLREHLVLVQRLAVTASIGVQAVARAAAYARTAVDLGTDTSQPWAAFLQTEDGEPIADGAGAFLDATP